MGVYSAIYNNDNESGYTNTAYYEASEFTLDSEGAQALIYESEAQYNKMMKSVIDGHMDAIRESGAYAILEAGSVKEWFKKFIQWLKDFAHKVSTFLSELIMKMTESESANKAYVKKYREKIEKLGRALNNKVEIDYYDFNHLDDDPISGFISRSGKVVENAVNAARNGELTDEDRKNIAIDMNKAFTGVENANFEAYFGMTDTKKILLRVEPGKLLKNIESLSDDIKKAQKAKKDIEDEINKTIDEAKELSSKTTDTIGKGIIDTKISLSQTRLKMIFKGISTYCFALRSRSKQNKRILAKLLGLEEKDLMRDRTPEEGSFSGYLGSGN